MRFHSLCHLLLATVSAAAIGCASVQGNLEGSPDFADVLIPEMEEVFAGIPRAREVHGSSSGRYQEIEGPPIAREILTRHRFPPDQIEHICGIVANHHSDEDPQIVTTVEFKILWDADWLVNFPGRHRNASAQEKALAIEEIFKTERGKQLAREVFLPRPYHQA